MRPFRGAMAVLALATALTGCAGPAADPATGAARDLAQARARWDQARLLDYTLLLSRDCDCPDRWAVQVPVRGGVPGRAADLNGVEFPRVAADVTTVDGLFLLIEAALASSAVVRAGYDTAGVPTSIVIDRDGQGEGEIRYRARVVPAGAATAGSSG